MHDVVIVGGGPAGSSAAIGLAPDHDVTVLEEHPVSGMPLECTGLVSPEVIKLSGVEPTVFNSFSNADIHFPDGSVFSIHCKETAAVLIDRSEFDRKLVDKAVDAGANYRYSEKCSGYYVKDGHARVVTSSGNTYDARLAIGADGHTSKVRATVCDTQPKMVIRGMQADIKHQSDDQDTIQIYTGSEVAPGFFGWSIPFGETTRVGMGAVWSAGPPCPYFNSFLKKLGLNDCEIVAKHAGKIPLGHLKKTYFNNTLLIGDAACQVKPVSGGGLYPIFKAVPHLVKAANEAFASNNFSSTVLAQYQTGWEKDIGGELSKGFMLRSMYNKYSDNSLSNIRKIVDVPFVHDIVDNASIDRPSEIYAKAMKHPLTAMKLLPYLIKGLI